MEPAFIFERMMKHVIEDDFINAKASIMSDINKIDSNPLSSMIIMTADNNLDLIRAASGFNFMSEEIQKYYTKPELAIIDYKNKSSSKRKKEGTIIKKVIKKPEKKVREVKKGKEKKKEKKKKKKKKKKDKKKDK